MQKWVWTRGQRRSNTPVYHTKPQTDMFTIVQITNDWRSSTADHFLLRCQVWESGWEQTHKKERSEQDEESEEKTIVFNLTTWNMFLKPWFTKFSAVLRLALQTSVNAHVLHTGMCVFFLKSTCVFHRRRDWRQWAVGRKTIKNLF